MTSAPRALADGIGRVLHGPLILLGVWLVSVLVALGPALMVRDAIESHLGDSLEAERGLDGVNYDWLQEFMWQAEGPAATLAPAVIGFGAVLDNASQIFSLHQRPMVVWISGATFFFALLFLSGGIIDRYARARAVGAYGFFGASGAFFFRFLRLSIVSGLAYAWLFLALHPAIDDLYTSFTANVTSERTAFFMRVALEVPFILLVAAVQLVSDYAKVRAVVEDRRSMLAALAAALRFLGRHGGAAAAVYLGNVLLLGLVAAAYGLAAPGAGGAGAGMWIGLAIGQLYIAARLGARLAFWASATALFQSRLAHAGYVAAPVQTWPDSPTVEGLRRG